MPFTFSHPAIILPLTHLPKRWFSITGLIIGSLTPDFEYFLRMKVQSDYSHTLPGLFWFDFPLGILLAFLFHNYVRNSLFDNLPMILKSRIAAFKSFDWNSHFKKNWIAVYVSIFIGAASHLFWDAFTHEHGYFVATLPVLKNMVTIFGGQIPLFKVLQHSSSLIGGLAIVFALFSLPADNKINEKPDLKYWSLFIFIMLAIITIRLLSGLNYKLYGHVIVTGISAGLISLLFTPWLLKLKLR